MTTEIRIEAEEARRLKNDTAFKQFMQEKHPPHLTLLIAF